MTKRKRDSEENIFRVLPRQVGETVGAALREWLPGQSWSQVRKLLRSRRVMLNGNLCVDDGRRLKLQDVVKILPYPMAAPPDEKDVRIAYLDKHVVVVEKPAGITVAVKCGMLSERIRSRSSLERIGWRSLMSRAFLGSSVRTFPGFPMNVIRDMTSSSRIGSIGGFVTWANSWRK